MTVPGPDRLPFTANYYQVGDKPAAVIPGHYGVVYHPEPRAIPWTELIRKGTPISQEQFRMLLI